MRSSAAAAVTAGLLLVPLASAANFGRPAEVPLANQPEAVALADGTQDGLVDILTTWRSGISLLPGRGDGRFERRLDYPTGLAPRSPVFGDWDGDGADDLAVASEDSITLFAGSDGELVRRRSYGVQAVGLLTAGDVDADGNLDLVATSSTQAKIFVLRGRGDGNFNAPSDYPVGSLASSVITTDLNGDDVLDIASAGSSISILFGTGDGGFEPYRTSGSPIELRAIAAEDLEFDGDIDLVAVGGRNQAIVFLNDGDGAFPETASYEVGGTPVGLALADLDDDGSSDILTVNRGSNDVSILRRLEDGSFDAQSRIRVGRTPTGLGITDLNGDATNDLVVSNRRSKSVTVLLNEADAPQPVVCLVPRVVRRTLAIARGIVTRAHCALAPVRRKRSARVRRGRVIAQSPVPGTRLPEGSRITLLVSRGPRR